MHSLVCLFVHTPCSSNIYYTPTLGLKWCEQDRHTLLSVVEYIRSFPTNVIEKHNLPVFKDFFPPKVYSAKEEISCGDEVRNSGYDAGTGRATWIGRELTDQRDRASQFLTLPMEAMFLGNLWMSPGSVFFK